MTSLLPDFCPKPPEGKVARIISTWDNQVAWLPDVLHNGKPTPCLTGRLYLFANKGDAPITSDGEVVVQLMRADVAGPDGEPVLIEQWPLAHDQLQQMRNRDLLGWGYSLALPWATYHPMLTNLVVNVCYTPKGGYPMYSRSKLTPQQTEKAIPIHATVQLPGKSN